MKREKYLSLIRNSYHSELIKVLSGVRRCGKSTILIQIIDELKDSGIKGKNIIYMNFEDYRNIIYTNPEKLHEYIVSLVNKKEKYYLFFDEIGEVEDFERVINSFRSFLDVSIFITGSNSKLLSSELSTYLVGRVKTFKIMPFTFKEYLEYLGENSNKEEVFEKYLKWGGLPQVFKEENESDKALFVNDLYKGILLKDIVERNNVNNVILLNKVMAFVLENVGGIISANSIAKFLKGQNINTTPDTVLKYIDYISASLLISKASRYDVRGKGVLKTLEKYYLSDLAFLINKTSPIEENDAGKLENIIYNELISRGYDCFVGKTMKGEIDFVVIKNELKFYIQVTNYLSSKEVIDREFNAFDEINDNYPKYVLSKDKMDYSKNGIIHKNIIDFLLDDFY